MLIEYSQPCVEYLYQDEISIIYIVLNFRSKFCVATDNLWSVFKFISYFKKVLNYINWNRRLNRKFFNWFLYSNQSSWKYHSYAKLFILFCNSFHSVNSQNDCFLFFYELQLNSSIWYSSKHLYATFASNIWSCRRHRHTFIAL